MVERLMFAKSIIDSDKFLSMPVSSRLLYYDLGMWADDDGFLNNPKKIIRNSGVTEDDLKILIAKNFIIPFDTGVIVITAWQINNYLRNDRYKETNCKAEKALLLQDENKAYVENLGIPMVDQRDTQYSIGKVRLGKVRIGKVIQHNHESKKETLDETDFTDDKETKLSNICSQIGLEAIQHKEKINDIMKIFYDMLVTRCVNRKVLRIETIEKSLLKLTPKIIDAAIDRITAEAQKKPIPNPKEYYKTTLMNAAVENNLLKTTAMAKKDKPSYDIDEYIRYSLKNLKVINDE